MKNNNRILFRSLFVMVNKLFYILLRKCSWMWLKDIPIAFHHRKCLHCNILQFYAIQLNHSIVQSIKQFKGLVRLFFENCTHILFDRGLYFDCEKIKQKRNKLKSETKCKHLTIYAIEAIRTRFVTECIFPNPKFNSRNYFW